MANRKNQYKKALGRKGTLFKKAYELGQVPGFEVALFVQRRGQITTFRSIDDESWWLLKAEIVS